MIVRSYTGRTVPEALAKVRNDLGENALIIETRTVNEPGLLGRRTGYEVVAAGDVDVHEQTKTKAPASQQPVSQASSLVREPRRDDAAPGLEEELAAIRRQLGRLAHGQGVPTGHLGNDLATQLEEGETPGEVIAELDEAMGKAGDRLQPERRREFLSLLMGRSLPCLGAIDWDSCRRLMLVGPTGVGKTTTLAKLAGELVLKRNRRVALLTVDTYRVGATDQLRAYADLLDIPLEVAATPAQFGAMLRRFEHYDNVLIDTAGRSPGDAARIHELKSFCRTAPDVAVMLAVAATSGRAEFAAVVERFSLLPIAHAVVTKLDECAAPGRLYGCLRRHRLPLNYVTTGQEVPDDIVPASPEVIAGRVLPNAVNA